MLISPRELPHRVAMRVPCQRGKCPSPWKMCRDVTRWDGKKNVKCKKTGRRNERNMRRETEKTDVDV